MNYLIVLSEAKGGNCMIIVQMSDLHCTSVPIFLRDKLTSEVNEINELWKTRVTF